MLERKQSLAAAETMLSTSAGTNVGSRMDENRRREIEEQAKLRTDDDERIMHVIEEHLNLAMFDILASIQELSTLVEDDERTVALQTALHESLANIATQMDKLMDTIPGLVTRQEAEEEINRVLSSRMVSNWLKPSTGKDHLH
jgi:hypothetical protein